MTRTLFPTAAAAVLLLTGCGSPSGEDAHRAAAAAALGRDQITDKTWADIQSSAEQICAEEKGVFALATTMSAADEADLALRRVNVEHVCPERSGELDEALAGQSG
ncbi:MULTISPECIES: hypothetical protein [unclassified Nocardiopsis]